ncbi:hypothetical protein NIES2101_41210 [Calothrix sp. HK-06]|nr:hypothetical protein NIES2101_41210 [Calothrix sp. HK-06]
MTNNLEVNVDALMQKIREEVMKRKAQLQTAASKFTSPALPAYQHKESNSQINKIEALLKNAESRAYVRTKLPEKISRLLSSKIGNKLQKIIIKGFNLLFRDQREVNFNLIQSLRESVALNRQLSEQINYLKLQLQEHITTVDNRFQENDKRLDDCRSYAANITNEQSNILNGHIQGFNQRLNNIHSRLQALKEEYQKLDESYKKLDEDYLKINDIHEELDDKCRKLDINDTYIKSDLTLQKRLINLFLDEANRGLPRQFNLEEIQKLDHKQKDLFDAFYTAFENEFRGSREEINNRLSIYIPFIKKAADATNDNSMVDLGCGRGEWLELIYQQGFKPLGIDINHAMVQQCQDLGLEAYVGNAINYLRATPADSFAVVSAFHVIEHLSLQELITLVDEAVRVLKPGGVAIFETPNPENLIVGACNFYLDPTHHKPIPPATSQFLLQNRGFCQVEVLRLHQMAQTQHFDNALLENLLQGFQDYAVIGWKPYITEE